MIAVHIGVDYFGKLKEPFTVRISDYVSNNSEYRTIVIHILIIIVYRDKEKRMKYD